MQIAIVGAHGKIGRLLVPLLVEHGDDVAGLIRNPDHAEDIRALGGRPVLCDIEHAGEQEVAAAISGSDAAVFAAGAGAGSGPERKLTVDRDGAIRLLGAAARSGVPRYLIISSVGAEAPPDGAMTRSASTCGPRPRPTPPSRQATGSGRSSGRAG